MSGVHHKLINQILVDAATLCWALWLNKNDVVFILWGNYARSKKRFIKNNFIIESAHPSPLSAYNGFFGSKPFSKCNNYLKSKGLEEIKW